RLARIPWSGSSSRSPSTVLVGNARDAGEGPAQPGPLLVSGTWLGYATASTPLLRATTLPDVILGAFGIAVPRFSSVIHFATNLLDSSACSEVSKRPTELMTPLPASIR